MSVQKVGTANGNTEIGGVVAGTWGSGQTRSAGNLLVAVYGAVGSNNGPTSLSCSGGWTQLFKHLGTQHFAFGVYAKVAAGSDSAPTLTGDGQSGSARCHVVMYELTGADTIANIIAAARWTANESDTQMPAVSLDAVTDSLGLTVFEQYRALGGDGGFNTDTGWTKVYTDASADQNCHGGFNSRTFNTEWTATDNSVFSLQGAVRGSAGIVIIPPSTLDASVTPSKVSGSTTIPRPSVSAGASSMTVTATETAGAGNGIRLRVLVLTGAKADQSGAGTGAFSGAAQEVSVATGAGNRVYGGTLDNRYTTVFSGADALSTFIDNLYDSGNAWTGATFRSTAVTASGTHSYGSADGGTNYGATAALEVLASSSGSISEHASGPALASNLSGSSVSSASFAPPGGALLVAVVIGQGDGSNQTNVSVSGGGLTWTPTGATAHAAGHGCATVWTAQVAATSSPTPAAVRGAATVPLPTVSVPSLSPATARAKGIWLHYDSSAIADATITTWAPRLAYVALNAWEYAYVPKFTAADPYVKSLVYKCMSSVRSSDPGPGGLCSAGLGQSYAWANANHPDWLVKRSGVPVEWSDFAGHYQCDVGNAAYQDMWASAVIAECQSYGWDGVHMDNVLYSVSQYGMTPNDSWADDAAMQAAYNSFLANVMPKLLAAGLLVVGNVAGMRVQPTVLAGYRTSGLTGIFDEYWIANSTTDLLPEYGSPSKGWVYQVEEVLAGSTPSGVQPHTAGGEPFRYAFASYLMAWEAEKVTGIMEATGYGGPGTWQAAYDWDLGAPLTAYQEPYSHVYRRNFSNGIAVANANTAGSQLITLGGTYLDMDGNSVSSITLGYGQGHVFRATATSAVVGPAAVRGAASVPVPVVRGALLHVPPNDRKELDGGHLTDHADISNLLAYLYRPGTLIDAEAQFGATGDGSADDTAALNSALAACSAGQGVLLRPGRVYATTGPVIIPAGVALLSPTRSFPIPSGDYGAGGLPLTGARIKPKSTFSGTAVIKLPTPSPGTAQTGGQTIMGITVDGTNLPAGNTVNGIESLGYVGGVTLRDVLVWGDYISGTTVGLGGYGLYVSDDGTGGRNPDMWDVAHTKVSMCGLYGIYCKGMADTWWTDVESTGNHGGGWHIINGSGSRWVACRGESNTGIGWWIEGISFSGQLNMVGCQGCNNTTYGYQVSGGSSSGCVYLNGCIALGNTTAAYNYLSGATLQVKSNAAWNTSTSAPTLS